MTKLTRAGLPVEQAIYPSCGIIRPARTCRPLRCNVAIFGRYGHHGPTERQTATAAACPSRPAMSRLSGVVCWIPFRQHSANLAKFKLSTVPGLGAAFGLRDLPWMKPWSCCVTPSSLWWLVKSKLTNPTLPPPILAVDGFDTRG
jgi:hypothetical protein